MTYHISPNDPAQMSTEELLAEMNGFRVLAVEVVERLSRVMKVLRDRRQPHAFFHDRILRFWANIANQTLSAEAAILLGNSQTIQAVLPLPIKDQVEIAKGREIAVAEINGLGDVRLEHMPINRMDGPTLHRVFGPEGIRSINEQTEILRKREKLQRIGVVTVLGDEQVLKIGNQKIKPEDLRGPLLALGYRLELARSSRAAG